MLGVGAVVFAGRQFTREEETIPETPPPKTPWTSSSLKPNPSIRAFRLISGQCLVSENYGDSLRFPVATYEIETPSGTHTTGYEAWIAGSDGSRLDLEVGMRGANAQIATRRGYPHAPPSPRLIVRYGGKKVIDESIDPLLPPIRTIPLVVSPHASVTLRPTRAGTLPRGFPDGKVSWYEIAGSPRDLGQANAAHIRRSEWSTDGSSSSRLEGEPLKIVTTEFARPESLAEIEATFLSSKRFAREIEVEIQIHDADGKPKVRVLKTVEAKFPDHGSVKIAVQDVRVQGSMKNGLPGNINLEMQDIPGLPALIVDSLLPYGRPSSFQFELLSPKLQDLGVWRLSLGAHDAAKIDKPTPAKLVLGHHRLKLRVTHDAWMESRRRLFVRVDD
ncbi:MAG: hypothetical protein ACO1SV_02155 [Fimbriimonas sp.]